MRYTTPLFDSNGLPAQPLCELLSLMEVPHRNSLASIRDATQDAWYQSGKLRAEINERHGSKKELAMPLFQALGLIDAMHAKRHFYGNVILLGATVTAVRKRLAFLHDEWNKRGVRFFFLAALGSDRALLEKKEDRTVLLNPDNAEFPFSKRWKAPNVLPKTEIEMIKMVFDQSRLPESWQHVAFLSTSGREGRPANTRDTLQYFGERVRTESVLLVSSQPFVGYQWLVADRVLPSIVDVECIGCAANPALPVSVFLDNIAKIVYELADSEGV